MTRWSSASVPGAPSDPLPSDPDWAGGSLYVDRRRRAVHASPDALWRVLEGIGGQNGWYSFPLAWRVRGLARPAGRRASGLRRGRRDPASRLRRRDASTSGGSRSATRAGCCGCGPRCACPAWPGSSSASMTHRRRRHDGVRRRSRRTSSGRSSTRAGCSATLYWWAVAPFHGVVFGGMARNIARAAERLDDRDRTRLTPANAVPERRHNRLRRAQQPAHQAVASSSRPAAPGVQTSAGLRGVLPAQPIVTGRPAGSMSGTARRCRWTGWVSARWVAPASAFSSAVSSRSAAVRHGVTG